MSIHRFALRAVLFVALPLAASPALAGLRHAHRAEVPTTYDSGSPFARSLTGSVPYSAGFAAPLRSARSSTLGNAEFPERDPIQQNLGNTAGGGLN